MARKDITDKKITTFPRKQVSIKAKLKRVKTLDDLFAQDDVNRLLVELVDEKTDIESIVVIYKTADGYIHYRTSDTGIVNSLGLIEYAKNMIIGNEEE
jgi:hypothetical protein